MAKTKEEKAVARVLAFCEEWSREQGYRCQVADIGGGAAIEIVMPHQIYTGSAKIIVPIPTYVFRVSRPSPFQLHLQTALDLPSVANFGDVGSLRDRLLEAVRVVNQERPKSTMTVPLIEGALWICCRDLLPVTALVGGQRGAVFAVLEMHQATATELFARIVEGFFIPPPQKERPRGQLRLVPG